MYLKIENKGVCPTEGFTLFGATTKRQEGVNKLMIGTFGSGAKHSIGVLLRAGIIPTIFCGKTKLEFFTKPIVIKASELRETSHSQVCCRVSGKLPDGSSVNRTDNLSFTLDYGTADWPQISMALREFVSNAIDGQIEETGDFDGVVIEPVGDNQVRAKDGTTRIFVEMTSEVTKFYNSINEWFLHFSDPEAVRTHKRVLSKISREKQCARIYRRGVFVRTVERGPNSNRSLYDYNLEVDLNESRTLDDWNAMHEVAKVISFSKSEIITNVLIECIKGNEIWEAGLSEYAMTLHSYSQDNDQRKKEWERAIETVLGDHGVLCSNNDLIADIVSRKGYKPIILKGGLLEAAKHFGARSDTAILSEHDRKGRTFSEANKFVIDSLDKVWSLFVNLGLTNGKEKPKAGCFFEQTDGGSRSVGLYIPEKETCYIHTDISGGDTEDLTDTMVEECAHHASGATDFSRDFQNILIKAISRMIRK